MILTCVDLVQSKKSDITLIKVKNGNKCYINFNFHILFIFDYTATLLIQCNLSRL